MIFIHCIISFSQEDCATAIPISLSSTYNGDNTGALPDNNYSTSTGCPSSDFNSSYWYSFSLPANVSSINITFNALTIGNNSVMTLVDDCTNSSSFSYIWHACDLNNLSGNTVTHCNLISGQIYYIQIASTIADAGSFSLYIAPNPLSPTNDICANAIEVFGGIIECGEFELMMANPNACPDPEATGNCVSSSDPGVWYTFETGNPLEYSAVLANPVGHNFEIFSSSSGDCSTLDYEFCSGNQYVHDLQPSTTYFVLVESDLLLQPFLSAQQTTCGTPIGDLDGGTGIGGNDFAMNSCVPGDPTMPCQNDNIVWYTYTVGCTQADITISLDQWDVGGPLATMTDGGIMAIDIDCSTILNNYDPNGTGYICSGIIGNEELLLNNMPPGYQFLIAVGSDNPLSGYYEVIVEENSSSGGSNNDLCPDAIVLNQMVTNNLSNICSTQDFTTPPCTNLSQSTVWYIFDPSPNVEDITINLNPITIGNTVIAAYSDCDGSLIDLECGNSLELNCVDSPVYLQIGSSSANEGLFDLEIQTANSQMPPEIEFSVVPICSGDNLDIQLEIPGGLIGDINVSVSSNNSTDLSGMNTHTYSGVSSAIIDDVIINCSNTTEIVRYEVNISLSGFNCEGPIVIIEVPVYPKFNINPIILEGCVDFEVDINISDIVTGGASPYQSIEWLLNGVNSIGTGEDIFDFLVTASGFIQVDVVDLNQCETSASIDLLGNVVAEIDLTIDQEIVCQGMSSTININAGFVNNGTVSGSSWTITDENNNVVIIGQELLVDYYYIEVDLTPQGTYTLTTTLIDENGCESAPKSIQFTIKPIPKGIVNIKSTGQCGIVLSVEFYSETGADIYNNGPDSNFDGIPDIFDLDNDGDIDINSITWRSPFSGDFHTDELSFVPIEEGIYEVIFMMTNGCNTTFVSEEVKLPLDIEPTINGISDVCQTTEITFSVEPNDYDFYIWTDSDGTTYASSESELNLTATKSIDIYVDVFDSFGCEFRDTFSLNVKPYPRINLTGSTTICPGEESLIDAGLLDTTWTYVWLDTMGNLISDDTSFFSFSEPGIYEVYVYSEEGCSDTLSFEITEDDEIDLEVVGDDLCGEDVSTLTAGAGFNFYEWMNENGNIIGDSSYLQVNTAGLFILSAGIGTCVGTDSIIINQYQPPNIELTPFIEICNNTYNAQDTLLDFNSLLLSTDIGNWLSIDNPSINLFNLEAVSFGSLPADSYRFVYTTSTAIPPCINISDTLLVVVNDCNCPKLEIMDNLVFCNTNSEINLSSFLSPETSDGLWNFINGPENIVLQDATFNSLDLLAGNYSFEYVLNTTVPTHCPNRDTISVELNEKPIVDLVERIEICNSESNQGEHILNLFDQLFEGIGNWQDPNISGLNFTDLASLDFTDILPGSYNIYFLTNDAIPPCQNILDSIQVDVLDCNCPKLNLLDGDSRCLDNSLIDLSVYENTSDSGLWSASNDNPQDLDIINSIVDLTNIIEGDYHFIYTLDNQIESCKFIDTILISLIDPPLILFATDTFACNAKNGNNENIINLYSLISTDETGNWFDNDGNIVDSPNSVDFGGLGIGTLIDYSFITNTAVSPCINTEVQVQVEIIDCSCSDPIFLDPPNLCNYLNQELNLQDLLLSNQIGNWSIIESPNGKTDMLTDSLFRYHEITSGTYSLEFRIKDPIPDHCQQNWVLDIMVFNQDSALLDVNPIVCTSNEDEISAIELFDVILSGNRNGYWLDEEMNQISNTLLDFNGQDTGIYNYVYVIENQLPCENTRYEFSIKAVGCEIEIADDILITIPNIFSPDGNGINDRFYPTSTIDLEIQSFYIFDRWGNKVYANTAIVSNTPENGWDGKFNGNYVATGVYVYALNLLTESGSPIFVTGDVTVIK